MSVQLTEENEKEMKVTEQREMKSVVNRDK